MTDREKVITALQHCIKKPCNTNCPYFSSDDPTQAYCLFHRIMPDALALLKEQEAVDPKIFQSEDFLWSHWYICGACEYPVDPGDKFCRKCGRPIKWEEDSDASR